MGTEAVGMSMNWGAEGGRRVKVHVYIIRPAGFLEVPNPRKPPPEYATGREIRVAQAVMSR